MKLSRIGSYLLPFLYFLEGFFVTGCKLNLTSLNHKSPYQGLVIITI